MVAIASEDSFYVLRFDRDAYNAKLESGADVGDEGVEEAFDLVAEISDKYATPFCYLRRTLDLTILTIAASRQPSG